MTDELTEEDMKAGEMILARLRDEPMAAEEIASCIRDHSAARGVDLWAVEFEDYSAAEWAEMTDRDQSTVARNVRRAIRDEEKRMQGKTDDE